MQLDPVTLEILNNKVAAITEEMCLTLQRTGRTLYVKETADFACALAGADGRFFAYPRNIGVSGFVGLECGPTIAAVEAMTGPLQPGDVILTNDPYLSKGLATHLPDLHMIEPYFEEGRIVAWGWCFVHCSDVGGRVPSSISPMNTEIFQEGLRIPPVRLMRGGEMVPEVAAFLNANSRTPDANMGDIRAMLAALAAGRRRVAQVVVQHGADVLVQASTDLVELAAAKARAVIAQIPEGTYCFSDYLDDDAVSDLPVRLTLAMTLKDGGVCLDFTGTDPQVQAAMNIPSHGRPHSWLTLRVLALVSTLDPSVPLNAGLLAPVSIIAPEGTVVNPVMPGATGVRHAAAVRVNDLLNGAFGLALPEALPAASSGTIIPVVVTEPDGHGGRNVQVVEPMIGGTGGRFGHDGVDGRDSGISNLANNPAETVEAELGVTLLSYALRPDSGGAGQWRGGAGMALTFRIDSDGAFVLARGMERLKFRPWGREGGQPGQPAALILNEGREGERRLGKIDMLPVARGDTVTFLTPGAGGYGNPLLRDPAAVLADVQSGLVSVARAAQDYGVILAGDAVDDTATLAARANRAAPEGRIDFGPERRHWDAVFSDTLMDAFNAWLLAKPAGVRSALRSATLRAALAALPEGFPHASATSDQITAARAVLQQGIAHG